MTVAEEVSDTGDFNRLHPELLGGWAAHHGAGRDLFIGDHSLDVFVTEAGVEWPDHIANVPRTEADGCHLFGRLVDETTR